jgi:transcriptional regulator with XRE-family HTH domain
MRQKMNPLKIQYELAKRGITQKVIADGIEVSEIYVSRVINHKKDAFRKGIKSEKIRRAVAAALGRSARAVFPEYYKKTEQETSEAA